MARLARILLFMAAVVFWGGVADAASLADGCRVLSGGKIYLCHDKSAPRTNTEKVNSAAYGVYKHTEPDGKVYYYNSILPPTFKEQLGSGCWTCAFVGAFLTIGDAFVGASIKSIAPVVGGLMNYLVALWILLQGVRLVFPGQVPVARTMKDIVTRSLVLMIAYAALSTGGEVLFIGGVYVPALSLPTTISATLGEKAMSIAGDGLPAPATCGGYTALSVTAGAASSPETAAVIGSIVCQMHKMQQVNVAGLALGQAVYNRPGASFWEQAVDFVPNVLAAVALTCVFGIALICFPFYIIDSFFRIVFLASLGPIFIVCACFLPTRRYALAALTGALQAGMRIVGIGAVYALAGAMLSYAAEMARPTGYSGAWNLEIMVDAFNGHTFANMPDTTKGYGFGDGAFWYMLMAGLMVLVVARSAAAMLSQIYTIEGGGSADYGAGLGEAAQGLAGTAVRGAFGAAMVPAAWGVGMLGKAAGQGIGEAASYGVGRAGLGAVAGFDLARKFSPRLDQTAKSVADASRAASSGVDALGDAIGGKLDQVRGEARRMLVVGLEGARDVMVDEGRARVDELIQRLSGKGAISAMPPADASVGGASTTGAPAPTGGGVPPAGPAPGSDPFSKLMGGGGA